MRSHTVVWAVLLVTVITALTVYGPSSWDPMQLSYTGHVSSWSPRTDVITIRSRVDRRSTEKPTMQGRHDVSTTDTTEISAAVLPPHRRSVIDDWKLDQACAAWSCSCQVLSNMTGANHNKKIWGTDTEEQRIWWIQRACQNSPGTKPTRTPLIQNKIEAGCAAWSCSCRCSAT